MEVRRHFCHINNYGPDGWHILSYIRGGFVGVPGLLHYLGFLVRVVGIVEHLPS